MEPEDKISFNEMDGLNIHDDVYRKVIKDFNILYERDKMGGNMGVHFPKHVLHSFRSFHMMTPSFKMTPICKIKFLGNFSLFQRVGFFDL